MIKANELRIVNLVMDGKDIEVVTVGNRGGEKIHEDLHENCEGYYTSRDAPRHTREELISMIEPIVRKLI